MQNMEGIELRMMVITLTREERSWYGDREQKEQVRGALS
jgi:hypothetical protein